MIILFLCIQFTLFYSEQQPPILRRIATIEPNDLRPLTLVNLQFQIADQPTPDSRFTLSALLNIRRCARDREEELIIQFLRNRRIR
jgi:hypothetical protein